ncbi:hypothetical protein EJ06DRAFT_585853 [Trichodelitschia bisporula]|uniref:Ankyrin n=1 Tax=Trichodelitschia bisporula TaxID=703511 RepID=A0A6G1HI02_9PEZI|nr:hypothetical protein EJ06DRAFT_585853 [Trichodelitschia bisporula]
MDTIDIFKLPPELFREILVQAVAVRGLKRGLRLRLVCKLFASEVVKAVIAGDTLADYCWMPYYPTADVDAVWMRFYVPYLRRLALHTPPDKAPRELRRIIEAAHLLAQRTDIPRRSWRSYIEVLCDLALRQCPRVMNREMAPYPPELKVLVAAAYLNLLPVVRECSSLAPGGLGAWGEAYNAAAKGGSTEALNLLLADPALKRYSTGCPWVFNALGTSALEYAAQHGHLSTVNMLLGDTWGHTIFFKNGVPPLHVRHWDLALAKAASSKEIFARLSQFTLTRPTHGSETMLYGLPACWAWCAKVGDASTLQRLFQEWPDPRAPRFQPNLQINIHLPLVIACGAGHAAVVELLLDHCPSDVTYRTSGLVAHAAAGGHLGVVKLLAERGHYIDGPGRENRYLARYGDAHRRIAAAIVSAIMLEHVAMFRYLRVRGALFDEPVRARAVGRAKGAGLTSMLALLASEGVDIDRYPPLLTRPIVCTSCHAFDEKSAGGKEPPKYDNHEW